MNIITGNKGFVGINLTIFLKNRNKSVLGISRNPNQNEISYNNLTIAALDAAKSFIHLAGKAHDLKKVASDKEYYDVNRDLTIKLFDKFLQSKCPIFIYISSVKASKDSIDEVLTEEHTPDPITVYGKSKLEAEKYILSKELPIGKKVYILRPCMIHGPFNKGNLNLLYTFVSKGIPYPLGSYSNLRSFVSIDNFCFLIDQLLEKKVESGIYNIADDNPLSTNKVVALIGETCGKKAKIWNISKSIISFLSRIGDVCKLPLNTERVDKLTENYVVSNIKIKKALSIKKLPISAEEGLRITINSFNKK
ncbi:NAD-dependent epimerase/dehydratase family protein [Polaribacter staleyi]|uniref:NAD-dependent epimerase/dehydratase family protein n=1 Tax=Polaribacter staleyi TaxID=2022337 RepID=UPI0031BA53E6